MDPMEEVKEKCSETTKCMKYKEILDECNDRVNSKSNTAETCTQELFDFIHCVDDCISKNLFKKIV